MGLYLNYEFQLPADTAVRAIQTTLHSLREFAGTQPFANVSPLISLLPVVHDELRSQRMALEFLASIAAEPVDDATPRLLCDVKSAHGFLVDPGRGCEPATFGLMRRYGAAGVQADWYWQSFCKTQHASMVSDAHLIACHTSLVNVLDYAIALGLGVKVLDETTYWETRDTRRLLAEVAVNHSVARSG